MRKIAPEVERLMWLIAEERDPRAISDFESRFPELKLELSKHMAMVSGLKTAGRKVPEHRIPRFVPRHASAPRRQTGLYIAVAFVAGALAFGSYAGVTLLRPEKTKTQIVRQNPAPIVEDAPKNPQLSPVEKPPVVTPAPQTSPAPEQHVAELQDPLLKPLSFDVESTPLKVAIATICKAAGISAEMPLALPEEDVTLRSDGIPAGELLSQLGKEHGFTVFPQETGKVLILPGRPTTEAKVDGGEIPPTSNGEPHPRQSGEGLRGREYNGSGR